MKKRIKRKPDFRRIRPTKTYTPNEISEAMDRKEASVHRWIREGLPILDGKGQKLILGADLKDWLATKWAAKKQKNEPHQMRCFSCQKPSAPKFGSLRFTIRNEKTLDMQAACERCGTEMHKTGSLAKIAEIENAFRPFMPQSQRIAGYGIPGDKRTIHDAPPTTKEQWRKSPPTRPNIVGLLSNEPAQPNSKLN